jgi:hypothetical protein
LCRRENVSCKESRMCIGACTGGSIPRVGRPGWIVGPIAGFAWRSACSASTDRFVARPGASTQGDELRRERDEYACWRKVTMSPWSADLSPPNQ